MRILVTRPPEDAAPLVRDLEARGHSVILSPMLHITIDTGAPVDLDGVQALLFTSANGVRAFANLCARRDLPVLTVGEATARKAREAGFPDVTSADGDAAALAKLTIATREPKAGSLFHAAGSVTAGPLKDDLERAGFSVRRTPLYTAEPADRLRDEAADALKSGEIDAVLFFSPRTARTFVRLAGTMNLSDGCGHISAVCLSPAVANAVSAIPWANVHTAERPEQAALLRTLDHIAGCSDPASGEA